jgi:DNA-binding MarR family transcriptional regulator
MNSPSSASARAGRTIERIGRLLRERENDAGLNPAQWEALRCLASANRFSRSPGAVAAWLATTRGTASQTLMSLERKGLVARAADPRDKRSSTLELTESGRESLAADPLASVAESISRLPPLHSVALGQSLARILDDLLGASQRPGFHPCPGCKSFEAGGDGAAGYCARFSIAMDDAEAERACIAHVAA